MKNSVGRKIRPTEFFREVFKIFACVFLMQSEGNQVAVHTGFAKPTLLKAGRAVAGEAFDGFAPSVPSNQHLRPRLVEFCPEVA